MNPRHLKSLPTVCPPDRVPREGEVIRRRVTKNSVADYKIDHGTGCWVWQKALNKAGYPFGYIHRKYWERANGPVPEGCDVHHTCRNPACINPDHLEALPQREHDAEHFLADRGRTLELIRRVRDDRAATGAAYRTLARKYDVPFVTVHDWCNGVAWAQEFGAPVVPNPPPRACPKCLQEFVPPRANKRFCSAKCCNLFNAKRYRDLRRAA